MSRIRPLTLVLLIVLSAALPSAYAAKAKKKPDKKAKIAALRSRLKSLSKKKEAKKAELHETHKQQRRLADQLNESYEQLEQAQHALNVSAERLQRAEAEVQAAEKQLREAEERLKIQQKRFGRRIAAAYREEGVTYADVLLGSRNLSDFMDRQYYVSRVADQDSALVAELKAAQREVLRQRQQVMKRRTEAASAHRENERQVRVVAAQADAREKLLKQVQEEATLQEQELRELEEDSQAIQGSLERELARRLANPKAFRSLPAWTGHFGRPANGPITSGFGYRYHPILHYQRLHSGIDFGAAYGSAVYAAADGEVFSASLRGGYGRCIIVLHGGNVSTLYGHLSRIDVQPGQSVKRGQVIGAVGNTGLSTGPHLHFEVRRNGVPVNPR